MFDYDPSGNRLSKKVYSPTGTLLYSNYYIRDASGNVMATYKANIDTAAESTVYTVEERHIYPSTQLRAGGSDRLGMYTYPDTVYPIPAASTVDFQPIWHGYHKYELKNHTSTGLSTGLGNVMTVVDGQKVPVDENSDNTIDYYQANIEAAYDYSPFGVIRKSFEPNYIAGTAGEGNPLAPDFMWCMDGPSTSLWAGDGIEKYGSGHDATLNNTSDVQDRDGNPASALKTTGSTSSNMKIADDADFDFGSSDFTVSIWVKKLVGNSGWNHAVAVGKWKTGGQLTKCEWYLNISNGSSGTNNPSQFTIVSGSTRYDINGPVLTIGDWTHLAGVRDGAYIYFYVDGVSVGSKYVGSAVINNVTGCDLLIAKTGNNNYLKAEFDEFAVYHRALDAAEVGDLYELGCADMDSDGGELASGGYRYGFNGMERDDEVKGKGNSINYKARIYDARLGRFLSIDPLTMQFPYYSPYQFAGNKPIEAIDLDGKEEFFRTKFYSDDEHYKTEITVVSNEGSPRGEAIVHESEVKINTATGTIEVVYCGSSRGKPVKLFDKQELSKMYIGPLRKGDKNISFGPLGMSGNSSFVWSETPANSSNEQDIKSATEHKNKFEKGPNTVVIDLIPKKEAPELPLGINAVPENPKGRSQKALGGALGNLKNVGAPPALGKSVDYEYQPHDEMPAATIKHN